ncbi:DUF397 domain-containing protein [Streptomyces sp. ISL-1]|uniref:DUF397 domain-containing protein n=1 Tax=Streptomyces sp. ISL-1 TaxID=2817657 RepID=UPI001BE63B49|nr:DUF397 domain-containing protein [Streptomyces sp. ISL-1]MBT2392316.1 DUF397 domain-containing protein [Streptomyces sp. ISL-1]
MTVEHSSQATPELHWHKSTHSAGDGGECIEVAVDGEAVLIRDSKNAQGPRLTVRQTHWTRFVRFAADG